MRGTLEVPIDSAAGLDACLKGGADRIELCSALSLGGLTPSRGLMSLASNCPIPVFAMIRPRDGDFCFSQVEIDIMIDDISAARAAGLDGVVLGAATHDGQLDVESLNVLCKAAHGMGRTLHRVVDTLSNPFKALDDAVHMGFDRVLTSGGYPHVEDGIGRLAEYVNYADGRIEIMAGSGLTPNMALRITGQTGIRSFHASCRKLQAVQPSFVSFGFAPGNSFKTDVSLILRVQEGARLRRLQSSGDRD